MDSRLLNFINGLETLSNVRGMDAANPVILDLQQPVTASLFTVIAAVNEPSSMGIPLNTIWVVFNPESAYNKKALKLKDTASPATSGVANVIQDAAYTQSWIELSSYDEVFADPQTYAVAGGTPGPQGPVGPQGDIGPVGPAPVVDYTYIVAQVLASIQTKTLTSITIAGAGTLTEGNTTNYVATAHYSDSTTQTLTTGVTWTADAAIGTISGTGTGVFTASAGSHSGNVGASFTYQGVTQTATKAVTVNAAVVPIYPFYGVADQSTPKNEALVLGLTGRGTVGDLTATFTLDSGAAGSTTTMFFAYPASYGLAQFEDQSALGFYGGWDAATGDPIMGATGPLSLDVTIDGVLVPFYLYQTDFPGLGSITWKTTHKP